MKDVLCVSSVQFSFMLSLMFHGLIALQCRHFIKNFVKKFKNIAI